MTPAGDTNSRRFRRGAAAERVTDPAEGIPLGLAVLMGIDLQRHSQPGMAQDELGVAGRDLQVLEQRRGGVPDMVHADGAQPVGADDAVK